MRGKTEKFSRVRVQAAVRTLRRLDQPMDPETRKSIAGMLEDYEFQVWGKPGRLFDEVETGERL